MSRWALQRMAAAQMLVRRKGDRGQTSFEYLGIAVVIAVIIVVLASTTDIGTKVKDGIIAQINRITGG
jgi:Flp pilus assembly pilin Flp